MQISINDIFVELALFWLLSYCIFFTC